MDNLYDIHQILNALLDNGIPQGLAEEILLTLITEDAEVYIHGLMQGIRLEPPF